MNQEVYTFHCFSDNGAPGGSPPPVLKQRGPASIKVSEKGAVSVYGLGRFPVTLYKEQWEKLLSMAGEIKTFMAKHDSELKKKE